MLLKNIIRVRYFEKDLQARKFAKLSGVSQKDARIFEFAVSSKLYMIITHDIDLFDPKSKGCDKKRRHKLVYERQGAFCKSAHKHYNITISCCYNAPSFICKET